MNKKLLTLAALATLTMALNATASAQIVTDDAGQPHYTMCKQGQPATFSATASYNPTPVNEVMSMNMEDFEKFSNTECNFMNGDDDNRQTDLRPVHEILKMTKGEFDEFSNRGNGDTAK